ncbi:hypothetical protein ABZ746_26830 [Streptomyces sp. NPDC020096]
MTTCGELPVGYPVNDASRTHEFWSTLSGPDVPKARMALKHVDDPQPADA